MTAITRCLLPLLALGFVRPTDAAAYTVKTTPSGNLVRWSVPRVELVLDPSLRDALRPGDAVAALTVATEAWRDAGGPEVVAVFDGPVRPYRPGDRHHGVYLLAEWPFEEGLLAVTATTFDQVSGRILDADILVNAEHPYAFLRGGGEDPRGAYDLASVLTHEVGHVLGLGESDVDPDATMWPHIGRGDLHQRTVAASDLDGIEAIYEDQAFLDPAAGCSGARVSAGPSRAATPWLLLLALGALLLRRRRAGGSRAAPLA